MTEQRHLADFTDHPDMTEMRDRYARILRSRPAVAAEGLLLLAGLYLAISPWAVNGFSSYSRMSVNNLIVGIAVALVGLAMTLAPWRIYGLSWTMVAIGIWQIVTPWVIGPDTSRVLWNNVATGCVIAVLGLLTTAMLMAAGRARSR